MIYLQFTLKNLCVNTSRVFSSVEFIFNNCYNLHMQNYENSFSWESLTRIVIMGVVVFLCWRALGALPVILVALVLAMAFYPVIKKVQNKTKIPLILCIFLILIIPLALIVYLGFLYVPRIIAAVPMLLGSLDYIVSHS